MTPAPPSTRFPAITAAHVLAEIEREAASRLTVYPKMVQTMRLTAEAAALEQRLCEAWAADLRRWRDWTAQPPIGPMPAQRHTLGFTWADRREGITRELERRARLYPKWIAAAQLDPAEARQRTDRLTALADIYDEGFDWHDAFGRRPPFGKGMSIEPTDQADTECRAAWWEHVHQVTTARHGAQPQEQLAL
ncbi:hypothetical protein [Novosphingobium capsulatum]|uniref:hypothetical protein n=1 Tax=Novosphingobium capsulatum TaxID=13688 RepID=UPI002E14CCDD|nr:hypothetical protein U0041_03845 [Novosphingobium capsulatum]